MDPKPTPPAPASRLLVLRLSALGDVILAMNAVSTLRGALPDASITWLVEDRFASVLDGYRDVDHVVVFERRRLRDARAPHRWPAAIRNLAALRRRLRQPRFDLSIDLQANLKSAWLGRLAGAPRRIGFASGVCREGNHRFTNEHVTPPAGCKHRHDRDLAMVRYLVGDVPQRDPAFEVAPDDATAVSNELAELGVGSKPFAILHPGTSAFGDFKRWPTERFARLADVLADDLDLASLVTWGPGEEPLARAVVDAARSRGSVFLAPSTPSLARVAAWLRRAALYVGADTGVTHLASTLRTPTIALFGPKDPEIYAPNGVHVRVVTRAMECRPCGLRYCPLTHTDCMRKLDEDDVFEAARDLLGRSRQDELRVSIP